MIEFDATSNAEQVAIRLRKANEALYKPLIDAAKKASRMLLVEIRQRVKGSSMAGLMQSWADGEPLLKEGRVYASVYSTHKGARLRDEGGTVKPVSGHMVQQFAPRAGKQILALAIPIMGGLKGSGYSGGLPESYGKNLFEIARPGKAPLLAEVLQKHQKRPRGHRQGPAAPSAITVRFILLKSATIKPHPYIGPAIESVKERVSKLFEAVIEKHIIQGRPT